LEAPEITLRVPVAGSATVAEQRPLPYDLDARDNVRVTSVRTQLFADKNRNGHFEDNEEVRQALLLTSPYSGSLVVDRIASYLPGVAANDLPSSLQLLFRATARDGAGNTAVEERSVLLTRNLAPEVQQIQILDSRGFNLGAELAEVTAGRGIVVNVVANDPEAGVAQVTLQQAVGADLAALQYSTLSTDSAAPFQFHVQVPADRVGQVISFRALARDVDGNESAPSVARTLRIAADQPPTAKILQPANDHSVLIDGQDLVVLVEALDDLGLGGIDHVVFHVNGRPVYTAYASEAQANGASGQENIYRAVIEPPEGVDGFAVQAVAFDALGQSGASPVVPVGRIDDTVAPKLGVLQPFDRDILTSGEAVTLVAAVTDIGVEAERHVSATWTREYQTETGTWAVLDQFEMTLHRDDNAATRPSIAVSDPTNHYYVYWGQFADGNILRRGAQRNERVRVVTRVSTPNHQVEQENIHEVGMPLSARYFLQPGANAATQGSAHRVFYNAVAQFKSAERTGALLSAWSTIDPMKVEQGLGTDYPIV